MGGVGQGAAVAKARGRQVCGVPGAGRAVRTVSRACAAEEGQVSHRPVGGAGKGSAGAKVAGGQCRIMRRGGGRRARAAAAGAQYAARARRRAAGAANAARSGWWCVAGSASVARAARKPRQQWQYSRRVVKSLIKSAVQPCLSGIVFLKAGTGL